MPGLPLVESARRLGRYRWLEERCFEVLGGWAASTPEPEAKLLLAAQSYHHAWHARCFDELLPVGSGLDPDGLGGDPGRGLAAFVHALRAPAGTAERLVGVARVLLPAKIAAYEAHLEVVSPWADGPTVRWLGHVLVDERADAEALEALLAGLLAGAGAGAVEGAEAHREMLEAGLVAAGGVGGVSS